MDKVFIIESAKKLGDPNISPQAAYVEILEFLRIYAGVKSAFYEQVNNVNGSVQNNVEIAKVTLNAFIRFLENDLSHGISIERKAQIDVVSDFLNQANELLETRSVHPAGACVLIGAALEEYMRNWIEEEGLTIGNNKPGIDTFCKTLKEADLITKQDFKDITSWAGLRNHAAHGEWDEVSDKKRIALMLEGVNLFMRKYGE